MNVHNHGKSSTLVQLREAATRARQHPAAPLGLLHDKTGMKGFSERNSSENFVGLFQPSRKMSKKTVEMPKGEREQLGHRSSLTWAPLTRGGITICVFCWVPNFAEVCCPPRTKGGGITVPGMRVEEVCKKREEFACIVSFW